MSVISDACSPRLIACSRRVDVSRSVIWRRGQEASHTIRFRGRESPHTVFLELPRKSSNVGIRQYPESDRIRCPWKRKKRFGTEYHYGQRHARTSGQCGSFCKRWKTYPDAGGRPTRVIE